MFGRRIVVASLCLLLSMSFGPSAQLHAGAGREYVHPIVFVREDSVYITDAQATTPDLIIRSDDASYSRPQWSPDGSQFVFSEYTQTGSGENALRLLRVVDGESPAPLDLDLSSARLPVYSTILPTAWSPDSTQVAYFDGRDVVLVSPAGSTRSKRFSPKFGYSLGEADGGGVGQVQQLVDAEREVAQLSTSIYLLGGAFGIWHMVSWARRVLWEQYFASVPLLSPGGLKALLWYEYLDGYEGQYMPVVFDLATQEAALLPVLDDATLLGWSADGKSVYFGTDSENLLTLWRISADAEDKTEAVMVSQIRGYAFGVMAVGEPGTPLVMSVITNRGDMSDADSAYTELVAVNEETGDVLWTMPGGKPAYGSGTFMSVVSD